MKEGGREGRKEGRRRVKEGRLCTYVIFDISESKANGNIFGVSKVR